MRKIQRIAWLHGISALRKLFSASKAQKIISHSLTVIVLFLSVVGCGQVGKYLDMAKDNGISAGYRDVLDRWTRKETVYSQFETKVQITATYKSEDFIRAYNGEYARIYYLTDTEKKRREDMESGFAGSFREIFFYAAMPDKEANDFDRSNSSWTIFLIDGSGNQITPLDIRRFEKITPLMEEFYPYINKYYGHCYSLKFPIVTVDGKSGPNVIKPMKVVFTSVLGKAELLWP